MIEVAGLRKEYGDVVAVDDVSFTAEAGAIFGLLGPNGAGKTTTIGCLSSLVTPTAGEVRVMGHDVGAPGVEARRSLGVVPQELALYEDVSATENLRYWGACYGLEGARLQQRVDHVLELVGLAERATERVKAYSGGMKRRLNFACGVVHEPKVLLLDEPTVGVDPQSRVKLLELVREQAAAGTCVLYTTHYMDEAEHLCDRLAVMDHGTIIAAGTLAELQGQTAERDLLRLAGRFDAEAARDAVAVLDEVEVVSADGELLVLAMREASLKLSEVFEVLARSGAEVRETTLTRPSLESLFIKLTGRELRE